MLIKGQLRNLPVDLCCTHAMVCGVMTVNVSLSQCDFLHRAGINSAVAPVVASVVLTFI